MKGEEETRKTHTYSHTHTYPSQIKESARGNHNGVVVVLVRDVNHVLDPTLDDELGAFIAGEEGHVHAAA